eukprot:67287_1
MASPSCSLDLNEIIVEGHIRQFSNQDRLFMIMAQEINQIIALFCGQLLPMQLYSIGNNRYGQQGIGNNKYIKTITKIKTFEKEIKDIISGNSCVYVLFNDGTYECCGRNDQLGIGHSSSESTFHTMKDMQINRIYSVPNGSYHAFCMTFENKLYAVGSNFNKQFGIETEKDENNKWIHIHTLLNIKKVSTTWYYTTFLSE